MANSTQEEVLSVGGFIEKLKGATNIKLLGCNPFVETLTSASFIVALRKKLRDLFDAGFVGKEPFFTLYIESEQEDFYQKLADSRGSVYYKKTYIDKKARIFGEKQANFKSALIAEMSKQLLSLARLEGTSSNQQLLDYLDQNVIVRQVNYRLPFYALSITNQQGTLNWFSPLKLKVVDIGELIYLDTKISGYKTISEEVEKMFVFLATPDDEVKDSKSAESKGLRVGMGGKKFTSLPNSELIEAYDKDSNKRVAIFDRKAFLTLEYKRASIWGFIFNRKGQLILQQRSAATADNRLMWDKSTGGHVDLTDASTAETAKREFIEEVYMKDSEYSEYNDSKIEMVVDFGEWRRALRADESFIEAFSPFTGKDKHVIMFRAFVEGNKQPLTVDRDSVRRTCKVVAEKNKKTGEVEYHEVGDPAFEPTRFRSDVFFYITAADEMDTEEQMLKTFAKVGNNTSSRGAAVNHRLISIDDLEREVLESDSKREQKFTDDLVHIVKNYVGYLTEFSSFVKDTFERIENHQEN